VCCATWRAGRGAPRNGPGGGSAGAWPGCRPGPFPEFIDGRGPRHAWHVITGLVINARRSVPRSFPLTVGQVMNKPNGTGWEYRHGCDGNRAVTPRDPFLSRGSGRSGRDIAGQGGSRAEPARSLTPAAPRTLGCRRLTPVPRTPPAQVMPVQRAPLCSAGNSRYQVRSVSIGFMGR
jgi:hypothetical protein